MKFAGRRGKLLFKLADVGIHFLFERIDKLHQFAIRAFHDQFDAPVRQISDIPTNVILKRDVLSGIPEANPLHTPRKMTGAAMHARRTTVCGVMIL